MSIGRPVPRVVVERVGQRRALTARSACGAGVTAKPCSSMSSASTSQGSPGDRASRLPPAVTAPVAGARRTPAGGAAAAGGASPSKRSISTSTCWPVEPCASRDEPRSAVSTFGLPCAHIESGTVGSTGSYHAPVERLTTCGRTSVGDDRAREARAAVVEHAHDVAVGDPARGRVVGMDADRLAARDLRRLAVRARVELAVQARRRLVRDQVQRELRGARAAQPLVGLEPRRMTRAVVVAEAGDRLGEQLDAAARRRELAVLGIGAEAVEQRVVVGADRQARLAGFPELVERRHRRRRARRPASRKRS